MESTICSSMGIPAPANRVAAKIAVATVT